MSCSSSNSLAGLFWDLIFIRFMDLFQIKFMYDLG